MLSLLPELGLGYRLRNGGGPLRGAKLGGVIEKLCRHHHLVISGIRSFPLLADELRKKLVGVRVGGADARVGVLCLVLLEAALGAIRASDLVHKVGARLAHG